MNWTEMIERVAADSGTSTAQTRKILGSYCTVCLSALAANEDVPLRRIGVLSARRLKGRTIRSVANNRKMLVGERYAVRFKAAAAARRAVASLLPQLWRTPEHQAAWRLAETLVADLDLYHAKLAPKDLAPSTSDEDVISNCKAAYRALWRDVERAYVDGTDAEVRAAKDYLAAAARRAWSA